MTDRTRHLVAGIAVVRLGAGIALGGAPGPFLRWEARPQATSMPLLLRTVGIRDVAIGAGTASALASGTTSDVRRWVIAGLVSDVLDVAAGLASARSTGARGVVSALIAAPMVVAGAYVATQLRTADSAETSPR